jgi:hypothetical protein
MYIKVYMKSKVWHNCVNVYVTIEWKYNNRVILGPFLFLVYINDLPTVFNKNSLPLLLANDTSVLVTNLNYNKFYMDVKETYFQLHT